MAIDAKDLESIRAIVIDGVEAVTGPRFDAIEKRLDEHDRHFVTLEKRTDSLEREMHKGFADVTSQLDRLEGRVAALENDIKDIYAMLSRLQHLAGSNRSFQQLSLENKLLKLNTELLATAKQAGITLPR